MTAAETLSKLPASSDYFPHSGIVGPVGVSASVRIIEASPGLALSLASTPSDSLGTLE